MVQNQGLHYSRHGEHLGNHGGTVSLDSSWVDLRSSFNNGNGYGHDQRNGSNGLYAAEKEKQNMGSGDPHSAAMQYPMDLQMC